jgi:arylsulfate sulfotransferase
MTFLLGKWLHALNRKAANGPRNPGRANRARPTRFVPRLEALEDRCLLSGGVTLTPTEAAPQLVGEPITWTATASDLGANPVYQFRVGPEHGPQRVVRDFSLGNSFTWAPMEEGTYDIQVIAKQGFNATGTESADALDVVNSRVTGAGAVITPTSNPLVALFSVPPTQPGPGPHGAVHVEFAVAGDNPSWQSTNELPSTPGKSTNFFVAGMLPSTTYEMRDVFSDGATSSPLPFTTGSLPTTLAFPTFTVQQPPGPGSDLDQGMIFQQFPSAPSNAPNPLATDLSGRVVWYYDVARAGLTHTYVGQSLVAGGTVLLLGVDQYAALPATLDVLREIDLAGNTVRQTNIDAVNAQLTALGDHPIFSFTHDVERLPNGQTAVIGSTERTINVNGTPTEYVGMSIVVLDKNFQVSWVWNSFDHLDVNRGPILGEILQPGSPDQLAASTPVFPAVDWLHVNAVSWSPGDGNLVLSLRHQDWVIKIDYANGAGDGHVLWRLGQGGDFTVNSTDPNPWFSHQHDAHFIDDSTLILFDNGNTRRASDPTADSRGQVWKLDEQTMTATLEFNVDMGSYSPMFGAAQRLSNGDYSFLSGGQGPATKQFGQTVEVRPDGSTAYVLADNKWVYRSFRIQTLYEGVSDQLAGDGQATSDQSGQRPAEDAGLPLANPTGNGLFGGIVAAALVDGTTTSDLTTEAPPAFQGLDVAVAQFHPGEPTRIASPVFALNFGAGSESLPALHGLRQAVGRIPPNPISPVFFGLENRDQTASAGPSQDALDQLFADLGDGDALWMF